MPPPPETSDWEISVNLSGKERKGKKGKWGKKKENWKGEGGKLEENFKSEERAFFFFFFFAFHF